MQAVLQPFQTFIDQAIRIVQQDAEAIGLAAGGSWISGEIDRYSDLDLVLVTARPIAPDVISMRTYAARLGAMLASFRGDHVGEPRLLIALYANPLLHVDIKFLTLDEFYHRVEEPVILWERDQQLSAVLSQSTALYPPVNYQETEDRFWIWMHYALLKIGRGEYFEALDFIAFVRSVVIGPMMHLKNGNLPRGVRRVETTIHAADLADLKKTVATPDCNSLLASLAMVIRLYEDLRDRLAPTTLQKNNAAELAVKEYFAVRMEESKANWQSRFFLPLLPFFLPPSFFMSSHHVVREKQEPALLIANGEACQPELLGQLLEWSPTVVVLDSAIWRVLDLGIKVDVLLGDFDRDLDLNSIRAQQYPLDVVHAPDQNKTDLHKGIEYLIERGYPAVNIVWATGRRADHTIANLTDIVRYKDQIRIVLLDDYSKVFPLVGRFEKWYSARTPISLIPVGTVEGVVTEGLTYNLHNESLTLGYRTSSSNEVAQDGFVRIEARSGDLLVMECWD